MFKIPSDDVLESLYKLRTRESDQPKTVSDSSKDIDAPLSKIENDGEKKCRSATPIAKL